MSSRLLTLDDDDPPAAAVATTARGSLRFLEPDSDPELLEREEEEEDVRTLPEVVVAAVVGMTSGCGEPSVELGGVAELLPRLPRPLLPERDFPFPQLKNQRPERLLPARDFFPDPERPRSISSASARVRERELFSVRELLVVRLLPSPPPPPLSPRLGWGRLRTLTAGRSLRLKLRWRLWYLSHKHYACIKTQAYSHLDLDLTSCPASPCGSGYPAAEG